jgi:hypothetical protein
MRRIERGDQVRTSSRLLTAALARPRPGASPARARARRRLATPRPAFPLSSARHLLLQVRGISLKLQEEERERRMDFVPDVSAVQTEALVVDPDTKALLSKLGMAFADSVTTQDPKRAPREFTRGPRPRE